MVSNVAGVLNSFHALCASDQLESFTQITPVSPWISRQSRAVTVQVGDPDVASARHEGSRTAVRERRARIGSAPEPVFDPAVTDHLLAGG
jgi:hypothetical protein